MRGETRRSLERGKMVVLIKDEVKTKDKGHWKCRLIYYWGVMLTKGVSGMSHMVTSRYNIDRGGSR
jgi:hypothetical protein